METVIWLTTMIPPSMAFSGIGIFAWKKKAYVVLVGD